MNLPGPIHELRVDRVGDADVVRVSGEIDLSNAHVLAEALAASPARGVVLDLSELSYIDSAGVRAVDSGYRTLVAEGRALSVVVPTGSTAEWVFRVTGLADGLVVGSLDEALAVVRER